MVASGERMVVEVEPRQAVGKNACRRLRREGRLPANVYGMGLDAFGVSVAPRSVQNVLKLESGVNTIFTLKLGGDGDGATRAAMIREVQRDPVTETMLHVDFLRVDLTRVMQVNVPILLVGTAVGVKNESGVMDFVHREVEVECLPGAIPEHIDVDVSGLHINQNVHVSDLVVPEGVRVLDPPESIIAVVVPPRMEEEPEAEVAEGEEAAAAPEAGAEEKEAEGEGESSGE